MEVVTRLEGRTFLNLESKQDQDSPSMKHLTMSIKYAKYKVANKSKKLQTRTTN